MRVPTWEMEKKLWADGYRLVAGVDEAGMGCLAGPVVAAAVILREDARDSLIRDSKTLSEPQREEVVTFIKERAVAWAVGVASVEEIDRLNIRGAGALAMVRAVHTLVPAAEFVLVDGFPIPGIVAPSLHVVEGDAKVKSIAAASIVAKTHRDGIMRTLDAEFPGYGFAKHKGYGTKEHVRAMIALGVTPHHRRSYEPVRALVEAGDKATGTEELTPQAR